MQTRISFFWFYFILLKSDRYFFMNVIAVNGNWYKIKMKPYTSMLFNVEIMNEKWIVRDSKTYI